MIQGYKDKVEELWKQREEAPLCRGSGIEGKGGFVLSRQGERLGRTSFQAEQTVHLNEYRLGNPICRRLVPS